MILPACKLGPAYIELIHDQLVNTLWPGTSPVLENEWRDWRLIDSATAAPFQSALMVDIYPSTTEKGAALFRSLNANHCFLNGNKRTAVMALNLFFLANGCELLLDNDAMYKLAEKTASYKTRGLSNDDALREILESIEGQVVTFESMREDGLEEPYQKLVKLQSLIRGHKHNTTLAP